ncbi:response regulator transcription factor [Amycolatopsis sp. NBC_00345]|uniref:response regulator transcription factor n=1 Tax=Amycolatopsis sp. NBC_00345 TaxID=2975955 RepID=UPI002E25C871
MRILAAEDEVALAGLVASGLRREAMAVDVVHNGLDAQERLTLHDYDVLVLDRDLPGKHGDDVCAELAAAGTRTKVLMLTAAGSLDDKVDGLGLGADDYLTKPFEYPELLARVHALGRRSQPALPPVLVHGDLRLDTTNHEVSRGGREIALSPKEFAVLAVLMRAQGAVLSSERLLELAWDEHTDPFTNAVRVAVSKLRTKLGEPPVIETVPGAGYRI